MEEPITVRNVDGSINQGGSITHYTTARIESPPYFEYVDLEITSLGDNYHIILGFPWLQRNNPIVNWKEGTMTLPNGLTLTSSTKEAITETPEKNVRTICHCYADYPLEEFSPRAFDIFRDSQQINAVASTDTARTTTPLEDMKTFVPSVYHKYEVVFTKTSFDTLPEHSPYDHAINLKPSFVPQRGKVYPLSVKEQKELDKFLHENLTTGRIIPSKSEQAAPFFFTPKMEEVNAPGADPGLRPIQDYRYLNSHTVRDRYPLPLLSEILQKPQLRTAKFFTAMDIRWGFNNIRIKEGDQWKAAFITNRGLYEPTVMFFGLCNSPSSFQRMIDIIFRDVLNSGRVFIYVDDCLIIGETLEELRHWTFKVLDIMKAHKLSCKPVKCQFEKSMVKFLGMYLKDGCLSVNPTKVTAISSWPPPTKVKHLESFLGTLNFWRKFIKDYSIIARPLNALRQKGKQFEWTDQHQKAFDTLKQALITAPVLRIPDPSQPYCLQTDATKEAIAGILTQEFDGQQHPIGYYSRLLNKPEMNYPTHDQELLAIINSLSEWRHLLEGSPHPILIRTDNLALKFFTTNRHLSGRQARWSEYLARFDYQIEYVPGRLNKADGLSRRHDLVHDSKQEDQILIPDSRFINAIINLATPTFMERLHHKSFTPELLAKLDDPTTSLTNDNGLVRDSDGRILVPDDVSLRTQIIRQFHTTPTAGHPGVAKTLELIQRNYFWPSISIHVANFVKSCPECQQTKIFPSKVSGLLQPIPPSTIPWEEVTADFIVELPVSEGNDTILVVVDRCTKRAHFIGTDTTVDAERSAMLFHQYVWKHHGWPKKIITDRGPQFAAKFTIALNKLLGTSTALSTAYHPQTDGQTERTNQAIEQFIRLFTNFMQTDWMQWLHQGEFAYNNWTHSSTGYSPFFLEYGRHPYVPGIPESESNNPEANSFHDKLQIARKKATMSLQQTATNMKKFADRKRKESPSYQIGDKVWLDIKDINTTRPSKKLDVKRTGPFEIVKEVSPVAFELKLPLSWKIHPVFHVSKLRPCIEDIGLHPEQVDDNLRPPPDVIDKFEEYEVERIIDHHGSKRRRQYLVKWKGYPDSENTWEPKSNLKHTKEPILQYEKSLIGV